VILVLAAVLAVAIAVGALVIVFTGGSDESPQESTAASTTGPAGSTPDTSQAPPTSGPLPPPTQAPTTSEPVSTPQSGPVYGSYVAMLWSDHLTNAPSETVQQMAAEKAAQYGVTTSVVYGDDFRTLRDGTVAVVYAGGFASPREAAQWCYDRGERAQSCIGVGLNDDFSELDRNGTGRMYVNEL
jgi:hypothetical protein